MAHISDTVEYVSMYFVMGETPKEWTRNDIKDPPHGGWGNAFIIRREGFLPKVFIPYTLQSWNVRPECYELERYRDPIKTVDPVWMKDCIERNYLSRSQMNGLPEMDKEAAGLVIKALGFEIPDVFKPEVAEKPTKERKVKPKSKTREAREGLISVASIAEELKIIPRVARGYLRAAKVEKPEHGWAGSESWAAEIKGILQAEMSKEKPAKVKAEPKAKPASKVKAKKVDPEPVKKALAPAKKAKKLPPTRKEPPKKVGKTIFEKKVGKAKPKKKGAARK